MEALLSQKKLTETVKLVADVIVVGNAIEKDPSLVKEMAAAAHSVPVGV